MNRNQTRNAIRELSRIKGRDMMYPQYIVFDGDEAELENFQTSPYAANDPATLIMNSCEDIDATIAWLESEIQ